MKVGDKVRINDPGCSWHGHEVVILRPPGASFLPLGRFFVGPDSGSQWMIQDGHCLEPVVETDQAACTHLSWDVIAGKCQQCGIGVEAWMNLKQSATLPAVTKPPVDEKEEELYRRWTGNAGSRVNQHNCGYQYPGVEVKGFAGTPWFDGHEERQDQAYKLMKRWVSSNHLSWPLCQHGHPINLGHIVRKADGGDGYLAFPKFECWGCR
jgi:hypothetical protein